MGLFSKKEKVPEISHTSELPDLPKKEEDHQLPELPKPQTEKKEDNKLPESPKLQSEQVSEDFNQGSIKSAAKSDPSPGKKRVGEGLHTPTIEYSTPLKSSGGLLPKLPKIEDPSDAKEIEPIFVRIDRFQSAQKSFEIVKSRLKEIESILKKIKDIRLKEDKEMNSWNEEIEDVKEKLSEIDSDIFDQI
jgi:hypothetical protein|tara:strand:- start:943 stop:1512 length:570 start_codon:yes stop_codon:yes gene_type:complete